MEQMTNGHSVEKFINILQRCRKKKNLPYAKRVLMQLCNNGLEGNKTLGNYLVPVFVECGSVLDAQQLFNRLVSRNEYAWTSLIQGYTESGESQHALNVFHKMREDCVHPSEHTFVALLKSCVRLKCMERGQEVHTAVAKEGFERSCIVGSVLVDMYLDCGSLTEAREVFDELPIRDVVTWTELIAGYAKYNLVDEALNCLQQMQLEGTSPNAVTFTCILKACGSLAIGIGQEIHAEIVKGSFDGNPFVGNTLVYLYAKCGSIAEAWEIFHKLTVPDVVSWNAVISAYVEHGFGEEALNCWDWMQLMGITPSAVTFIGCMKACGSIGGIDMGHSIQSEITKKGFEKDSYISNSLVDMYVKCGSLVEAQYLLDNPSDNDVGWSMLIAGYSENGLGEEALVCFERMQLEGLSPSVVTFVSSLKACGSIGDIDRGQEIHSKVVREAFEGDQFVGNKLVDMYAKCGSLVEAQEIFDKLPVCDMFSWTALVSGCAENVLGEEAMHYFQQMLLQDVSPDAVTSVCTLKACGTIGAVERVQEVHVMVTKDGFESNPFVGSTLVDIYAKVGLLAEAQELFNRLQARNLVSWNAIISVYAENGNDEEALNCFECMQLEGVSPNAATFACALKACGSMGTIDRGRELHTEVAKKELEGDSFAGNALVDMYAKCCSLAEAGDVFEKLPLPDVVSWTALIAGHVEHGLGVEALNCLYQMQLEEVILNAVTVVCGLKACGSLRAIDEGRDTHVKVINQGFERDPFVASGLVDMYAKCGSLSEALEVFDKLTVRETVAWNTLISGYVEQRLGEEVLDCILQMQLESMPFNAVTFVCSLKVCSSIVAIDKGRELHAEVTKEGLERDVFISNVLVDMYAKCGSLAEACKVFDKLPVQDVVASWNILMAAYYEYGFHEEALNCFLRMQLKGVSPNAVTFGCILKVCKSVKAIELSQELHVEIIKSGFDRETFVGSTLVYTYAQFGSLSEAQEMLDKLPVRDVVSFTALVAGYAEYGLGEEALKCIKQMQLESLSPSSVTFSRILKACSCIGAIDSGQEIHTKVTMEGLERDPFVCNSLVDMYAKCGSLAEAYAVFDNKLVEDAVLWNTLITGHAHQGQSELVFHLFERMMKEGIHPNAITFLSVLTVCSHEGLVKNGQKYFEAMGNEYGVSPTVEHLNCMVDLLGRAGQLHDAVAMLEKMPFQPDLASWTTLLGACRKWGNVELARQAFECAMGLDEKSPAAFFLMSNIYAEAETHRNMNKIKAI